MSTKLAISAEPIFYPETDGKPMAENTLQYDWITMLVGSLREMNLQRDDVFIAGDLFWYPVEGFPAIVQAPDTLVAIGRPKGFRRSYKQWEEGGVAPQVVFEVLSPSNTDEQMDDKRSFYERHGVEEYYVIEPFTNEVEGWVRRGDFLKQIAKMNGWVSPRLGIRFEEGDDELIILTPEGRRFVFHEHRILEFMAEAARRDREMQEQQEQFERELRAQREKADLDKARHEEAERKHQAEREKAERKHQTERLEAERKLQDALERAEQERKAKESLIAKLREAGIDPETT